MKSRAAWIYIYKHYRFQFDFFIKADPDTYLVVENLLDYLQDQDPEQPRYYGHRLVQPRCYGQGLVPLSRTTTLLRTQVSSNLLDNQVTMDTG